MRKLLLAFCAFATICSAGAQWKPAGDKIKTDWAEKVDPRNVLPEYPRPGMERADWQNLNGEWEYAILPKGQAEPTSFDGISWCRSPWNPPCPACKKKWGRRMSCGINEPLRCPPHGKEKISC